MHLRLEDNKDHVPSVIEVPDVGLVPLEKLGHLIVHDLRVLHFSCFDVRKEEVLDPLEDGVEDEHDGVHDHSQRSRHLGFFRKRI